MINIARLALFAALSLSAASVACSAPPPAPSPTSGGSASTESQDQKTARSEDGTTPPSSGGKAGAPSSNPDGGAPPEKGGGGDGEKEVPPADPQCVASCNSGLKAKCQGDDTFCEDICSFYTAQEIACISQAPSCEKSVWIQCTEQDNGGGK